MSTKIYNGLKFKGSLIATFEALMGLKPQIYAAQERIEVEFVARISAQIIDDAALQKPEAVEQQKRGPLSEAVMQLEECQRRSQREGTRTIIDTSFEVVLLPHGVSVYAISYTDNRALNGLLLESGLVHEYGYWDQADRPEGVTAKEWCVRKKVWDAILSRDGGLGRPGQCGMFVNLQKPYRFMGSAEVLVALPSRESRVNRVASNAALAKRMQGIDTEDVIQNVWKNMDWLRTDEGKQAVATEAARIEATLPEITADMLLGR